MNPPTPPRIVIRLLESLLPEEYRDAVVGDLIEESALRARASTRATATWWCWGQVARSIPLVLGSDLQRRHWLGTLGVAIAAYVAASVLESVGVAVVSRLLHPDDRLTIVLSVIVGLATMVLGEYAAASIRQGAARALAGIILIVVAVLMVTMPDSAPLWYGLTFLIAGPAAALAGGRLSLIQRAGGLIARRRAKGRIMRRGIRLAVLIFSCGLPASCAAPAQTGGSMDFLLDELVALERSALDRWIRLEPQGYLDLYAPDVTYFDVSTERRIDSLAAMQARLAPMKTMKPPFSEPRYERVAPRVQQHGDVALLTFNLINYGKLFDGVERELARWNSTEVYARVGNSSWKIIHSHRSYVQPPQASAP